MALEQRSQSPCQGKFGGYERENRGVSEEERRFLPGTFFQVPEQFLPGRLGGGALREALHDGAVDVDEGLE